MPTIADTIELWNKEPEKAKGKPKVEAHSEGTMAVIAAGPFSIRADLPPALGGSNEAPSPTALLLGALAGCAVVFVRDTLGPQLGVRVDAVTATAQCDTDARGLLGMDGAAPDLASIRLEVRVSSPDGADAVRRVERAWHERCPIYLALTKAMRVETSFQTA